MIPTLWAIGQLGCVTDGEVAGLLDRDGDGFAAVSAGGTDCDDRDPAVFPGAGEVCDDGIDNDCDGARDDFGEGEVTWYRDQDGDGFGNDNVTRPACAGWAAGPAEGWSLDPGDCDDGNPARYAGALEACDGIDNDCNDRIDDGDGIASTSGQRYDTVAQAFSAAPTGDGVVRVCAGNHAVPQALDAGSGARIEVRGAGASQTTLVGADQSALLSVQDAELHIADVTLVGPSAGPAVRARGASTLVLADVVVRDCPRGVDIDGAVAATLTDTEFVDVGRGSADHGGLTASGPFALEVQGGRFERNRGGSAIRLDGSVAASLIMMDTVFRDNEGDMGGALHVTQPGSFVLQGVQLVRNEAERGGALYVAANVELEAATVTDNRADVGAGLFVAGGRVTVDQASWFKRNAASERSGAAHLTGGTLVVQGADFGAGPDDNTPEDIESDDGLETTVLGIVANTICTPAGCSL